MEKGFPVWWRGLGVWQDHVQTRPGATSTPGMALEPTLAKNLINKIHII